MAIEPANILSALFALARHSSWHQDRPGTLLEEALACGCATVGSSEIFGEPSKFEPNFNLTGHFAIVCLFYDNQLERHRR